jgi:hypothetical protein
MEPWAEGRTARKWLERMGTLQQKIADQFLEKLASSKALDREKLQRLRALLADKKRIKAETLVEIFSAPSGGDIK